MKVWGGFGIQGNWVFKAEGGGVRFGPFFVENSAFCCFGPLELSVSFAGLFGAFTRSPLESCGPKSGFQAGLEKSPCFRKTPN